jgi:hypothetical protein
MGAWSRDRAFESRSAPQLIASFVNRAVEDVRMQGHDVIGVQVQEREFVPLVGHASGDGVATVVAGENRERLRMLGDEARSPAANQIAQLVRAHQVEASVLQLLSKDRRARPVARRLEFAGKGNHIAVANTTDL